MLTTGRSTSGGLSPAMTAAMNYVDLIFAAQGDAIPRNHGYALYGAVARVVPSVHQAKDIGIFPINGSSSGDGVLLLTDRSMARFRVPADRLPMLLPLAGKAMELDGHRLRLGVPHVAALIPAPVLSSSLVLIKLADAVTPGDAALKVTSPGQGVSETARVASSTARRTVADPLLSSAPSLAASAIM